MQKTIYLLPALLLSACASITEGTKQDITINTNPQGADCNFTREGGSIGRIYPTPGTLKVQKNKHDITISCRLAGYNDLTFINKSDVAGGTFGNIILGGGIGWAVDSARGADNKYDAVINFTFTPVGSPIVPPMAAPSKEAASAGSSQYPSEERR